MSTGNTVVVLVLLLAILAATVPVRATGGWNYDSESPEGPAHWSQHYPTCGRTSQSPINIPTTVVHTTSLSTISRQGYSDQPTDSFELSNSGHSAVINVSPKTIYISGGGLPSGKYYLEQLHFHWGTDDSQGSEHLIDSKSYPLEIHLVHFSEKYGNVSHAAGSGDQTALAVLGVFASVTSDTSKISRGFANFINKLPDITFSGNSTTCQQFELNTLLPQSTSSFYRYNGSLTTPGCAEVVVWTVFSDPIYIDSSSLIEFRKLHSLEGTPLDHNFRPVQALNNRFVYHQMPGAANIGQQKQSLAAVVFSTIFFMKFSKSLLLQ